MPEPVSGTEGYADEADPVNTLVSEREPVEAFATFHGFEG